MRTTFIACWLILSILTASCTEAVPSTPVISPTMETMVQPASTSTPVSVPTDIIASLVPHGQPLSEWNGIPIMPGAIEGQGDSSSYRFTTAGSWVEIQSFYASQLSQLGWELMGSMEGEDGAVMLIFEGGDRTISISILSNGDTSIVVIVM